MDWIYGIYLPDDASDVFFNTDSSKRRAKSEAAHTTHYAPVQTAHL